MKGIGVMISLIMILGLTIFAILTHPVVSDRARELRVVVQFELRFI